MPLRFSYLSVTRRLFLIALLAAVFLPPAPTAADPRFAPLSKRGVVAIVRHARATGNRRTPHRSRSTTVPPSATSTHRAGNRRAKSAQRSAPQSRPFIGPSPADGAAAATLPASSISARSRTSPALNWFFRNRNAGTMSTQYLAGARAPNPHSRPRACRANGRQAWYRRKAERASDGTANAQTNFVLPISQQIAPSAVKA